MMKHTRRGDPKGSVRFIIPNGLSLVCEGLQASQCVSQVHLKIHLIDKNVSELHLIVVCVTCSIHVTTVEEQLQDGVYMNPRLNCDSSQVLKIIQINLVLTATSLVICLSA